LYGQDFSLANVLMDNSQIPAMVGQDSASVFSVAQSAITLIAPSPAELVERLPSPPNASDSIAIFTDVRQVSQCSTCPLQSLMSETALEERILALYGPEASNQVQAEQISSFSFADLQAFLDAGPHPIPLPTIPITPSATLEPEVTPLAEDVTEEEPGPTPELPAAYLVQEALEDVDWIIFAMIDSTQTSALNNFLAQRQDIVRNTRVIVLAYNAPYYLDTTEISKLTAYFGVYSKAEAFIDASVRALFQELPANGRSPVNIEGISYDLFRQTQPDPAQVIALFIIRDGQVQSPPSEEPLEASIGDTLRLQTGVIYDHNGNPVPDGTPVQFIQSDRIQGLVNIIAEVPTTAGIAQLDYVLEARTGPGQFRITAMSGEARASQEVDIFIEGEAQVAIITPTAMPTATPTLTPTATSTATPTSTATATPTPIPEPLPLVPEEPGIRIKLSDFEMLIAVMAGLLLTSSLGLVMSRQRQADLEQQIGWALWGVVGSLILYIYYALGLPGTAPLIELRSWAGLITTLIGGLLGLVIYQIRQHSLQF
jgi:beta-N-acetylhexosaminidase